MKRKLISAALAATMVMGITAAAPVANASEYQNFVPIMAELDESEYEALPAMPWYGSFTGKVVEINPLEREEGTYPKQVVVENEDGGIAWLNINEGTFCVTGNAIEVGSSITGFFEMNMPMIMIYPPQYTVRAIAVDLPENQFVAAARFSGEYLVSDCGMYRLNITEETNVILQDGSKWFDSEYGTIEALEGRKMIVVYDVSTRSIPALINPIKVVVMFEIAVHLPGFDLGLDIGYGSLDEIDGTLGYNGYIGITPPMHLFTDEERADWLAAFGAEVAASEIVVDNEVIAAPASFLNEEGIIMLPLRAISEALGFNVYWHGLAEEIWLNNTISLRIGEDAYTFARMPVIELGTAPVLTAQGFTFVPITFFTDVVRVPNVFFMNGQVVIDQTAIEGGIEYNGESVFDEYNLPEESEVQVV